MWPEVIAIRVQEAPRTVAEYRPLLSTMSIEQIRISEIFGPTIQGEGALIGQPTVFVRTGGCDYRCRWCDTMYAVDSKFRNDWLPMDAENIMLEVTRLSADMPLMVSLSGGNPAIQPLQSLIRLGKSRGYRFALETQGSVARQWFNELDVLTLSPKPPSSEMSTDWQVLQQCVELGNEPVETVLKLVVFDETDYQYARQVSARFPSLPIFLQPGNHTPPQPQEATTVDLNGIHQTMQWLIQHAIDDKWYRPTILPQLHVMLWGNQRGV